MSDLLDRAHSQTREHWINQATERLGQALLAVHLAKEDIIMAGIHQPWTTNPLEQLDQVEPALATTLTQLHKQIPPHDDDAATSGNVDNSP